MSGEWMKQNTKLSIQTCSEMKLNQIWGQLKTCKPDRNHVKKEKKNQQDINEEEGCP